MATKWLPVLKGRSWLLQGAVIATLVAGSAEAQRLQMTVGDSRLVNAVVASIDGKAITLREFEAYELGRGRLLPVDQRRTRSDVLGGMIEEALLTAEFERQQIKADDEDTQYYIERVLEMNQSSRQDVERALAEIGLSWSDYFERMRFEVEKLALINREIRSRVHVTDEEVERYWRESSEYDRPPGMEVSQIVIGLPADGNPAGIAAAEQAIQEAHRAIGETGFARAAKRYSQGPTATEGGKLGSFEHGTLAPAFEDQLAKLQPGEHTQPFEEGGGLHILRLDRVSVENEGGRPELDDELREEIRERLYDDLLDERLKRWVDEDLKKLHHVTVRIDRLDELMRRPVVNPSEV
jgi:peptidyl-prolyl cis-trans isomerase SurA